MRPANRPEVPIGENGSTLEGGEGRTLLAWCPFGEDFIIDQTNRLPVGRLQIEVAPPRRRPRRSLRTPTRPVRAMLDSNAFEQLLIVDDAVDVPNLRERIGRR
jgi:hypothetical protein